MSRIIVKHLPPYITPLKLREHFSQKEGPGGILTDVKVSLKPDGTSRRFGFIGYKTDSEAKAAKDWFDRTFVDSTRINVEIVEGVKGAPAPRPNKRPRLGPGPSDDPRSPREKGSLGNVISKHNNAATSKEDGRLIEFMQVMQPRTKKTRTWANEEEQRQYVTNPSELSNQGPGKLTSEVDAAKDDEELSGDSDLAWIQRRMTKGILSEEEGEKAFIQSDEEGSRSGKESDIKDTSSADAAKEVISQTSRLFLRNLAFSCSDTDLLDLFRPFGEISQVHIPTDALSKQSKGLAFVTFAQPSAALSAYEALDKVSFQGRLLHILPAVDRRGKAGADDVTDRKKSLKEERENKRKVGASKEFNWGMLYMNSDAVVSSIADRMNISKADILNSESETNAAVKLALAETHVIQETKTYLESQGVALSSFDSRARSDTTILVKNIPYGTSVEQIRELFGTHGELRRIIVPPAGTMAVVEFEHPGEASKAFRAVAYRRMGNSVIYLEKGPLGMFDAKSRDTSTSISSAAKPITIPEQDNAPEGEDGSSAPAGSTLFIKNLSFSTTSERLSQVFKHLPFFSFARVHTKPDPKRPGPDAPRLSMGYGFIGFKTADAAKKALQSMQGFVLDGHSLHVRFSGRGAEQEPADKTVAKSRTTKMIVKNVPFEATKKDIRELFGAHGNLKSVRLPKKFDSRSRGFAFLDFVSRHEAENAYASLRHTHLLGRHLVLDWADEADQDLNNLRKKAGVGYGGGAELPGRKRKLELPGDDGGLGDGEAVIVEDQ